MKVSALVSFVGHKAGILIVGFSCASLGLCLSAKLGGVLAILEVLSLAISPPSKSSVTISVELSVVAHSFQLGAERNDS